MKYSIQGNIAPPMYSPFLETASKVVAVPKSTIMSGPPYFSNPAIALTIRSAPTSVGLLYKIGNTRFYSGTDDQWIIMQGIFGTTLQIPGSKEARRRRSQYYEYLPGPISLSLKNSLASTQYSSVVRFLSVRMRQWVVNSSP